jgi:hypothetical protein
VIGSIHSFLDPSRHLSTPNPSMLHLSSALLSLTQAELVKRMRVQRAPGRLLPLILRPSLSTVYHVCPAEVRCDSMPCLVVTGL